MLALVVVALLSFGGNTHAQSAKPNILFIMADDLGWNDVGYRGKGEVLTPNIDILANDGVRLENYYVGPTCGPTRSQFLSGRYAIHLGLHGSNLPSCTKQALPTEYPTIANELKDRGYSTHAIGKWHAGFYSNAHLPTSRGFDTFRGFLLSHARNHYAREARYQGTPYRDYRNNAETYTLDDNLYSTDAFTNRAKEIIGSHNTANPMFMYLSYQAAHTPWQAPSSFVNGYSGTIPNTDRLNYAAMVTALDDGVGQVVEALKLAGMYNNTVIIFSSDNGGATGAASNYPLKGGKGSYYEGGIRAVGFVSSPLIGAAYRDRDVTSIMHVTDWLPTVVSIAGSTTSLSIDGVNQWNVISQGASTQRTEVLHHIETQARRRATSFREGVKASIVTSDGWKMMTGSNTGYNIPNPKDNYTAWEISKSTTTVTSGGELFNIYTDPEELVNEYNNPDYQTIKDNLLAKLFEKQQGMLDLISDTVYDECNPDLRPDDHWGPWV